MRGARLEKEYRHESATHTSSAHIRRHVQKPVRKYQMAQVLNASRNCHPVLCATYQQDETIRPRQGQRAQASPTLHTMNDTPNTPEAELEAAIQRLNEDIDGMLYEQEPQDVLLRHDNDLRLVLTALAAARKMEAISWQVGTPVIGSGEMARYWCAVKGSAAEGRRLLCYGNAYIMPLSDSCHDAPANAVAVGDDGDYAWTGWFETSCDQCDTYWAFHGEVLRWFELPEATRQLEGKQT